MRNITRFGLAALLAIFLAPGLARADGLTLDDDSLQKTLTGLGYTPSHLSKGFLITLKNGSFSAYTQVVLSDDKTRIGYNANLGMVDEPAVTADQWEKLMAANGDNDPYLFYYDPEQKKLYFHFSMENRNLDPALIQHYLDGFVKNIQDSASLWKFTH